MKIVLISHFYPPAPAGGAAQYAVMLAQGLQSAGWDCHVLCAGDWDKGSNHWNGFEDDIYNNVPVRRLQINWAKAPRPFDYIFDNPVLAGKIREYLEAVQPSIVHVISPYTLSAQAIAVPKEIGLPVVVHLVDMWFICPNHTLLRPIGDLCYGSKGDWDCQSCLLWGSKAYRWTGKILRGTSHERLFEEASKHGFLVRLRGLRGMLGDVRRRRRFVLDALIQADAVIAPSRAIQSLYEANGFPAGRIRYIPYGHSTDWAKSVIRQKSAVVRFGFLGNVIPIKGVRTLVGAFREVVSKHQAELHIFGYDHGDADYADKLRRTNVPGIAWHGGYSHADLGRVFAQVEVLVFPSVWHENNPLVIQEAFAAGCPVICSDVAGAAEQVDDEVNGLHFRAGDPADLAHKMTRILTEPDLFERLRRGIKPVRTIEQELIDLSAVYDEVIRESRALRRASSDS